MRFSTVLSLLCLIAIAGCSQHTYSSTIPTVSNNVFAPEQLPDGGFKSIYSFKGNPDGQNPYAGLAAIGSTLYGTTQLGGKNDFGVAFKVSTSGTERVIHQFLGGSVQDGSDPDGQLIVFKGTLYGTTYYGGPPVTGYGSVYRMTTSGSEHAICGFKGQPDAQFPYAGVVALGGKFYGTTYQGGKHNDGAVYSCTASGAVHLLHSFALSPDGAFPYGRLAVLGGALYGTTYQGGTKQNTYGYGTVYKVTTAGVERVLHKFGGYPNDGAYPYADLAAVNGVLYGTTFQGGSGGDGTVFKITPAGTEQVIYSFKGGPDGALPYAGVIAVNGTLYGTTSSGGKSNQGTIFKVSTAGKEVVLHSFTSIAPDGADPIGNLLNLNGTLYGTTFYGGKNGDGIVFKISP